MVLSHIAHPNHPDADRLKVTPLPVELMARHDAVATPKHLVSRKILTVIIDFTKIHALDTSTGRVSLLSLAKNRPSADYRQFSRPGLKLTPIIVLEPILVI